MYLSGIVLFHPSPSHGEKLPLGHYPRHCHASSLTSSGEEINYLMDEFGKTNRECSSPIDFPWNLSSANGSTNPTLIFTSYSHQRGWPMMGI